MRDAYTAMVTLCQMRSYITPPRNYEVPEEPEQMEVLDF